MNIKLSPMKSSKKKLKKLQDKQNNWVLDCVNQQKSKLKPYSSMKDKYLKYFVVRVPKKKSYGTRSLQTSNPAIVDSTNFKNFLNAEKEKILSSLVQVQKSKQTDREQRKNYKQDEKSRIAQDKIQNHYQNKQLKTKNQKQKAHQKQQKMKSENASPSSGKKIQHCKRQQAKTLNKEGSNEKVKQQDKLKQEVKNFSSSPIDDKKSSQTSKKEQILDSKKSKSQKQSYQEYEYTDQFKQEEIEGANQQNKVDKLGTNFGHQID